MIISVSQAPLRVAWEQYGSSRVLACQQVQAPCGRLCCAQPGVSSHEENTKMKRIVIIALLIFFLNPVFSFCQETKGINKDLENLSGQCAECAAYFRLVYHEMISSNETDTAKSYRELEDMVMLLLSAFS
jgi:hypothetical protein